MHKPPAAADPLSLSETLQPEIIAAVDLGSNSFHMIVGELRHGQLAIIDRIKETVRLAEGLSPKGDLSSDARQRALDCLSRFGERLRDMRAGSVRAAGTSTIRRAREDTSFMSEAEALLGHPIEVISGIEEARLVYTGVMHSLPPTDGMRLVTDIGGGSTEVILGQGATPNTLKSLHMGCVSMTERFFPDGILTRERFSCARMAARLELRPIKAFFRGATGIEAIGTSGTVLSTENVARELGLAEIGITLDTIETLIDRVLTFDNISELSLNGLSDRRAQVWPGGLSILAELFTALRIDEMRISDGAVREGLLYDLLGRLQHEDARERTVRAMASRYQVDEEQARRVSSTAADIHAQCAEAWQLNQDIAGKILGWAARLHEIGLDISHDGATLIRSQRHRVEKTFLDALPKAWRKAGLQLVVILRLAVLLNRSRNDAELPPMAIEAFDDGLSIGFDSDWLAANPLTIADLEREQEFLAELEYKLALRR